ncbi:uncharacterized protein V1518DRAFT_71833 [Limtongia smithiae]|uniref:uncharacterized protein n=1 Tax=Limtongia smithiae TaxID=1125753 RepID=UPI0034CE821D
MVFKSFVSIARHSALAKNLFVASTATSAQPAFFVSTQQLARQQVAGPTQQLLNRGTLHSFSASGASSSSTNGAAFTSYSAPYNPNALPVSTAGSDDDHIVRATSASSRGRILPTIPPLSSTVIAPQHARLLSTSSNVLAKSNPDNVSDIANTAKEYNNRQLEEDDRIDPGLVKDEDRFVEVDDETAASIIAESQNAQNQYMQVQLYRSYNHFSPASKSDAKVLEATPADSSKEPLQSEPSPAEPSWATSDAESQFTLENIPADVNPFITARQAAAVASTPLSARSAAESEVVIDRLFKSENYVGVLGHYGLMKDSKTTPSLLSFNQILITIATGELGPLSTERVSFLIETYVHMLSSHIVPDVQTYSVIITTLVKRYISSKKFSAQSYDSVKNRVHFTDPTFDDVMHSTSADPSLTLALDVFFASVSVRPQNYAIEVYNALLEGISWSQLADMQLRAQQVLEVLDRSVEIGAVAYNGETFVNLIRAYTADINAAVEIFEYYKENVATMAHIDDDLVIYAELIRAFFNNNDPAGAINFFEKVMKLQAFDPKTAGEPLCDVLIAGFISLGDYQTAWTWLQRSASDFTGQVSLKSLKALLTATSLAKNPDMADEVYSTLLSTHGLNMEWADQMADYLQMAIVDSTSEGLRKVIDLLETVIASSVRLEMHSTRDVAVYMLEHPSATEDTVHQAFMFVEYQTNLWHWSSREELHVCSSMLESLLIRMISLVKWSEVTDAGTILSRILRISRRLDFNYLIPATASPDNFGASLLGMILRQHWSSMDRGIPPPLADLDSIVYLHSRFLVNGGTNGEFAKEVVRGLSELLIIIAKSNIPLSENTNYFVTIAAPLLNLIPDAAPEMYVPEQVIRPTTQVLPSGQYDMPVPPEVVMAHDADIPMATREVARGPSYKDEQRIIHDILGFDVPASQEIVRMILIDSSPQAVLQEMKSIYRGGRSISTAAIVKAIVYAGSHKAVSIAEQIYSLATDIIPSVEARPSLHYTWQAIYKAMISMYFQAESKSSLDNKEKLVAFKAKLIEIGTSPDATAYANFILKLKLAGSHDEAQEAVALFDESRAYGVRPSTYLYNALLSKLSKARRYKEALAYFREMDEEGIRKTSVTYGTMISACCRAGDEFMAEELFAEMENAPNYKPRVPPFNTMLQFYVVHKQDREQALKYFQRMRDLKLTPTSHSYKLLIDAFATIEPTDIEAAEQVLVRIKEDRQPITIQHYAALINAYGCVNRDLQKAQQYFDFITKDGNVIPDETMYQPLIESYILNGEVMETDRIIRDMQAKNKVEVTGYMANILIRGWAEVDIERSRQYFDYALSQRKAEPSTFEAMIRAYLSVDLKADAEQVFGLMPSQNYPDAVVSKVEAILHDPSSAGFIPTGGVKGPRI